MFSCIYASVYATHFDVYILYVVYDELHTTLILILFLQDYVWKIQYLSWIKMSTFN